MHSPLSIAGSVLPITTGKRMEVLVFTMICTSSFVQWVEIAFYRSSIHNRRMQFLFCTSSPGSPISKSGHQTKAGLPFRFCQMVPFCKEQCLNCKFQNSFTVFCSPGYISNQGEHFFIPIQQPLRLLHLRHCRFQPHPTLPYFVSIHVTG